jgi:putative ABC transport system ATP-binding protein
LTATEVADVVGLEPESKVIVRLEAVSKVYATGALAVRALHDVTLTINRGEYVAVVGPSGSGKSTLMNILGCLDVVTDGRYWLNGIDVEDMSEAELAVVRNQQIGFVFQQFNLLPSLSALRNVELPLCYAGRPRHERRDRALRALDRVGLADRVDHRPAELSGGQQQRVAMARALVTEPALILADEPTGNLDSRSSEDVMSVLAELNAAGRTIVLITHDHGIAQNAHRTLSVLDGVVRSDAEHEPSGLPAP